MHRDHPHRCDRQHRDLALDGQGKGAQREAGRSTQEVARDALPRAEEAVAGHADDVALLERPVGDEQVRHVTQDGDHLDVVAGKTLRAVLHHGLLLARIDQRVKAFLLGAERIPGQLVVAHVGADHDEAPGSRGQLVVVVVVLDLDPEPASGVDRKAVEDDLPETEVVRVDGAQRPPASVAEVFAEQSGDRTAVAAVRQHVEDDHHRHDGVEAADVHPAEQHDERPQHPRSSVGRPLPAVMRRIAHRRGFRFGTHRFAICGAPVSGCRPWFRCSRRSR